MTIDSLIKKYEEEFRQLKLELLSMEGDITNIDKYLKDNAFLRGRITELDKTIHIRSRTPYI